MLSVTHFRSEQPDFLQRAQRALTVLAARPGYRAGSIGRSTDADSDWVIVTEWADVGSYRRALGAYDVKMHAAPLLGEALDHPSSFEQLVHVDAEGSVSTHASDRA